MPIHKLATPDGKFEQIPVVSPLILWILTTSQYCGCISNLNPARQLILQSAKQNLRIIYDFLIQTGANKQDVTRIITLPSKNHQFCVPSLIQCQSIFENTTLIELFNEYNINWFVRFVAPSNPSKSVFDFACRRLATEKNITNSEYDEFFAKQWQQMRQNEIFYNRPSVSISHYLGNCFLPICVDRQAFQLTKLFVDEINNDTHDDGVQWMSTDSGVSLVNSVLPSSKRMWELFLNVEGPPTTKIQAQFLADAQRFPYDPHNKEVYFSSMTRLLSERKLFGTQRDLAHDALEWMVRNFTFDTLDYFDNTGRTTIMHFLLSAIDLFQLCMNKWISCVNFQQRELLPLSGKIQDNNIWNSKYLEVVTLDACSETHGRTLKAMLMESRISKNVIDTYFAQERKYTKMRETCFKHFIISDLAGIISDYY